MSSNPLCAFFDDASYCYTPASWQLVKPFYWYKDSAYEVELGNTIWKVSALELSHIVMTFTSLADGSMCYVPGR